MNVLLSGIMNQDAEAEWEWGEKWGGKEPGLNQNAETDPKKIQSSR